MAHATVSGVLRHRLPDRFVLDRQRELGQGLGAALEHAGDGLADGVALCGCRRQAVQRQNRVNPLHRPSAIALGVKELQRAESQLVVVGRHREVQPTLALAGSTDRGSQRVHRHALVKGVDRHAPVAPQLRGRQGQMRRLARPGRAEHEGVPHIANVEVQPERRRTVGHAIHQWRRLRRVHGAWRAVEACPDGARWQHVGQVHGVDERPAHVLDAMPRQAAEVGFERVDRLDAGCEAKPSDRLFNLASGQLDALAAFIHQNHDAGVVALRDQAAVDLGNRRLGVGHHGNRVVIDRAG